MSNRTPVCESAEWKEAEAKFERRRLLEGAALTVLISLGALVLLALLIYVAARG